MSKYFARKTTCKHGHSHASRGEARRCAELHLLQAAGEIVNLQVEPQFWFVIDGRPVKHGNGRRAGYRPDFLYTEVPTLNDVVEDFKGGPTLTEAAVLRMALFRHLFPQFELRVVK